MKKGYAGGGLTVVLGAPVDTGAGLPAHIQAMLDNGQFAKAAKAIKALEGKSRQGSNIRTKPKKESIEQKKRRGGGFNKGGYAKCGASNPPSKKR